MGAKSKVGRWAADNYPVLRRTLDRAGWVIDMSDNAEVVGMSPLFSIVIPTFNRSKKLKETLKSVLAQSFTSFEVLVMDDGSTDDTPEVVKSFRDNRIRYEWAPNSGGPSTPRNRGIDASKADWICFLDADDLWYPDKLKRVSEMISQNPECDVICHNELMLSKENDKKILSYGPFERDFYRKMLTYGNCMSTSATTVKRSFLERHDLRFNQSPDYVIVEDYDLWLRIAFFDGIFYFMDDILGEYRVGNENISSNIDRARQNLKVLLREHVFKIQNFESDKNKLWRIICAGSLVSESKDNFIDRRYMDSFALFTLALRESIFGALIFISVKLIKKLKY